MRILYIHQYFKTPEEGGSLRSYHLCRGLVRQGHEVTLITAHNEKKQTQRLIEGIHVIYLPVYYEATFDFHQKLVAFFRFAWQAMGASARQRNIDCCYVMTTPLTTGLIALFNQFVCRRPYVFEVGDLWPKVAVDMGIISSGFVKNMATFFEKLVYRKAKGLVGLSPPITEHLRRLAPHTPVHTVTNLSDCHFFKFEKKPPTLAASFQVEGQLVVCYAGAFGLANQLEWVVDFAQVVRQFPVSFLMVGEGAEKEKIKAKACAYGLENIRFFDAMNRTQLSNIIRVSDAMLVSFAPFVSLHTGSPNKFFDALAAGKLVITNFEGWIGDLIRKEKCGIVISDVRMAAEQLMPFLPSSSILHRFQSRARQLAQEYFEVGIQSQAHIRFLQKTFQI